MFSTASLLGALSRQYSLSASILNIIFSVVTPNSSGSSVWAFLKDCSVKPPDSHTGNGVSRISITYRELTKREGMNALHRTRTEESITKSKGR
jgi:hypothetical protein